jgi:hypothetical protein
VWAFVASRPIFPWIMLRCCSDPEGPIGSAWSIPCTASTAATACIIPLALLPGHVHLQQRCSALTCASDKVCMVCLTKCLATQ